MERRDFIKRCTLLCAGGVGLSLATPSCGSIHYVDSNIEKNKLKINKAEFIDAKKRERKFVVIRSEQLPFPICVYKKNNECIALYMECAHQSCELNPNETTLVCPCHGSEFSSNGEVLNPPADKNLKQFNVITDDEYMYVEL